MKILLTGGNGVLGQAIQKRIPNWIATNKSELDITNKQNILDFVKLHKIDTIIHAAALTSIRNCEENKELTPPEVMVHRKNTPASPG